MLKSILFAWILFPIFLFGAPSHYEELKPLDWLVGDWVDSDEDMEMSFHYAWDENKNFLTNSFSMNTNDKTEFEGKLIIGFDPDKKVIRSWLFDSDGGFGEGQWRQKGNQWIIEVAQTLPDGGSSSAIHIITKKDDNAYTFESVGRTVDGEILPDVEPVTIIRKKDVK